MDNSEIALKLMPIIDISVDLIERVVRYWWKTSGYLFSITIMIV
jgi:hypothetical protein